MKHLDEVLKSVERKRENESGIMARYVNLERELIHCFTHITAFYVVKVTFFRFNNEPILPSSQAIGSLTGRLIWTIIKWFSKIRNSSL